MLTSSVVLNTKNKDLFLVPSRAKSSLSKISLSQPMTLSKPIGKIKSSKHISNLGLEATQLSLNNKNLEEKVFSIIGAIKKLKNAPKDLKLREIELEVVQNEMIRSEDDISEYKKRMKWFEEKLPEMFQCCKGQDDGGFFKILAAYQHKDIKKTGLRSSLSIEELLITPKSTKNRLKSSRNSIIRSPYDSNLNILTVSNKKLKQIGQPSKRVQAMTPSIFAKPFSILKEKNTTLEKKLEKVRTRVERVINSLKSG